MRSHRSSSSGWTAMARNDAMTAPLASVHRSGRQRRALLEGKTPQSDAAVNYISIAVRGLAGGATPGKFTSRG